MWNLGLKLTGFKTWNVWSEAGLLQFIGDQNFTVMESAVLADRLSPECYVAARKHETSPNDSGVSN